MFWCIKISWLWYLGILFEILWDIGQYVTLILTGAASSYENRENTYIEFTFKPKDRFEWLAEAML